MPPVQQLPRYQLCLNQLTLPSQLTLPRADFGFGLRRDIFHPLLGDGIFTQEGPDWKHSRKLLQKQFARTQYQDSDHFREHVDNLLACLDAQSGVVDLQPLFFRLTLDTTTALLFGQSVHSLRSQDVAGADEVAFAESFNTAQEGLAKRFRIAPWHFFYNPSSFRLACSNIHRFVDDYIQSRSQDKPSPENSTEPPGFFEEVARESINNTTLRDQLINVLLAVRDTAACCMSWTVRLLVRHPPIMQLLREEIRSVIGSNRHPRREQLQQMPYLRKVIRESLRLYPPVPLNNRTALRTTMLPTGGGPAGDSPILVRRGEVVIYSSYVNSRRKNIWGSDADLFVPERWDRPELGAIGWAYFPFSGGPRVCLGQDFALMEVSYTIVRLLQAFENISLPPNEEIEPLGTERQRLTLVLSSADGCRVQPGGIADAAKMAI